MRAVIEHLDGRRARGGAPLLIIIGASGAGKSSLLKAGVLPQLARRRREWIVLPTLRPEKAPMEVLTKAVALQCGKPNAWRDWKDKLTGPQAADAIAEWMKDLCVGEQRHATVLLPVDQFEELFTVAIPEERSAFLRLLSSALNRDRDLPMIVLATGRSDVLHGLLEAGELARFYEAEPLAPMPLDRVSLVVEGPAAVASLHVDHGLAEQMRRDLESADALPLLAYTLWILHQRGASERRLSLAHYKALGDAQRGLNPIQNSVRRAADETLERLEPKPSELELSALRDAFIPHLVRVRLDDGKRVRQPAQFASLPEDARRLVQALVSARLLVTRDGIVEVAHEALFAAWPTLQGWLDEEQSFLADYERLKGAYSVWAEARAGDKSEALLRGLLLARARQWLAEHPRRFVGAEAELFRSFVQTSANAEDRDKERKKRLKRVQLQGLAASALLVVAIITAMVLFYSYRLASDQASITRSTFLADLARQHQDRHDFASAINLLLEGMPDNKTICRTPSARRADHPTTL